MEHRRRLRVALGANVRPMPWSSSTADVERLVTLFDELGIRAIEPREPDAADGEAADRVLREFNRVSAGFDIVEASIYATVSTNSRDEQAQGLMSELEPAEAAMRPLLARLSDWVQALGAAPLAQVSDEVGRAPRPADPPRGTRRPPDVGSRGAPVRRAVGRPGRARGAGCNATSRRSCRSRSPCPTVHERCRCRPYAGWRPTPMPPFAGPPTRPSCAPGRPSSCPSPRR